MKMVQRGKVALSKVKVNSYPTSNKKNDFLQVTGRSKERALKKTKLIGGN